MFFRVKSKHAGTVEHKSLAYYVICYCHMRRSLLDYYNLYIYIYIYKHTHINTLITHALKRIKRKR